PVTAGLASAARVVVRAVAGGQHAREGFPHGVAGRVSQNARAGDCQGLAHTPPNILSPSPDNRRYQSMLALRAPRTSSRSGAHSGSARLNPGGGRPFPTALDFLIGHISVWQWRAVRREYPQNCSITINSTISAGG